LLRQIAQLHGVQVQHLDGRCLLRGNGARNSSAAPIDFWMVIEELPAGLASRLAQSKTRSRAGADAAWAKFRREALESMAWNRFGRMLFLLPCSDGRLGAGLAHLQSIIAAECHSLQGTNITCHGIAFAESQVQLRQGADDEVLRQIAETATTLVDPRRVSARTSLVAINARSNWLRIDFADSLLA
jgi:hypothetical protein